MYVLITKQTCEQWQSAELADSTGFSDLSLKMMFSVLVMRADFKDTALSYLLWDWSLDDEIFSWPKPQEQVTHQSYQWVDRDLAASMCPDVEFSFSCCCSLCSEVTSTLWPLWGKVFLLLGSGNCPGRYQRGSNAMRRSVHFHVHLSGRPVSLATPCPHCGLQAATVPLIPHTGNSTPRQEGTDAKAGGFFQDLSRKSASS